MAKMIRITSLRDGFRRAGVRHPKAPTDHPVSTFNEEQLAILRAEPLLIVAEIETDEAASDGKKETKPSKTETSAKPEGAEALTAAIVEAIGKLDESDKKAWTAAGDPQVTALEAILGYQISAAERDAAWETAKVQAEAAKTNTDA